MLLTQKIGRAELANPKEFRGLLAGFEAASVLSWGLLEMVPLRRASDTKLDAPESFAAPEEHMKIVEVPSYGTVVLRNTSREGRLIVPMHIGFFQVGAQNHATSRTLVMEAGETYKATDCFCIQAAQGGLLQESQQRFLMLPLSLRLQALAKRGAEDFSRLWGDIDVYTRQHGMVTGGHLERFLRPCFKDLLPMRHALESVSGQVGAAYFVAGRLVGVEVAPTEAYWKQIAPVLTMYCYGPAALLAERRGQERISEPLDLEGLASLDDLAQRLDNVRARETCNRADITQELASFPFQEQVEEERHDLRVVTLGHEEWAGQVVREGERVAYASVLRS